jgi:two-component system copper resistance phosphate regulon response regulator CusR
LVPLAAHRHPELPQNMRILVVEDEIKAAEYLQQGLIESGYMVDRATDGFDGLYLALQNDYDIVLLDVNLPTMDGWEVLELIRRRKQTRIIMLTANGRLGMV